MVTLFYQTAIDHAYFYEIEFAKLIIRYHSMENSGVYSAEYQRGLRGELMDREVKMEQVQIGLITAEG